MMSYDVGHHPMTPIPMSLFYFEQIYTYLPPFCVHVMVGVKRCVVHFIIIILNHIVLSCFL